MRNLAFSIYHFLYFVGLRLLLIGQLGSIVLATMGKTMAAFRLPIITIGIFVASVATVFAMIEFGR